MKTVVINADELDKYQISYLEDLFNKYNLLYKKYQYERRLIYVVFLYDHIDFCDYENFICDIDTFNIIYSVID